MKPLRLDFMPDHSRFWAWLLVLATAASLAGAASTHWIRLRQDQASRLAELATVRIKTTEVQKAREEPASHRTESVRRAAKVLQQDLNGVFATVENFKEPGIRLRSLTIDVVAQTVRVDYEMDSVQKAAVVTTHLNGGHEQGPWKLEGVRATRSAQPGFTSPNSATLSGVWSVPLAEL